MKLLYTYWQVRHLLNEIKALKQMLDANPETIAIYKQTLDDVRLILGAKEGEDVVEKARNVITERNILYDKFRK